MTGPDPRTVSLEAADSYVKAAERLAEAAFDVWVQEGRYGGKGDAYIAVVPKGALRRLKDAWEAFEEAKRAAK